MMTDKEFKHLNRAQLIEIIYQLQLQNEKLVEENKSLEKALEDKRLRIDNAGNLAQAALEINNCFKSAQDAAEQYLNEIREIRTEAEAERQRIINKAKEEAASISGSAQNGQEDYSSTIESILKEYRDNHSK